MAYPEPELQTPQPGHPLPPRAGARGRAPQDSPRAGHPDAGMAGRQGRPGGRAALLSGSSPRALTAAPAAWPALGEPVLMKCADQHYCDLSLICSVNKISSKSTP